MSEMQPNAVNRSSTDSEGGLDAVLAQLTLDQIRFVIARQECATDKDAAKAIGMAESTINHWPKIVKDAVLLMAYDGVTTARHMRKRSLAKAMAVKLKGLDSKDERVRQGVATEVIEWELGKSVARQELSGPDGKPIQVDAGALTEEELQQRLRAILMDKDE